MTVKMAEYATPLLRILRPGRAGEWAIRHRTIPGRTRVVMFSPGTGVRLEETDEDFPMIMLEKGFDDWMSTAPFDQDTSQTPIREARGDVLIGGLGIGLVPLALAAKDAVTSVRIVELQQEVISLVWNQLTNAMKAQESAKLMLERGDVLEFLRHTHDRFDYIALDIWANPLATFRNYALAQELARRCLKPDGVVWIWLEENYPLFKDLLEAGPRYPSGVGRFPPCIGCGRTLRADYGGVCTDCASDLGISEVFLPTSNTSKT